jgi:hypothetical protein
MIGVRSASKGAIALRIPVESVTIARCRPQSLPNPRARSPSRNKCGDSTRIARTSHRCAPMKSIDCASPRGPSGQFTDEADSNRFRVDVTGLVASRWLDVQVLV